MLGADTRHFYVSTNELISAFSRIRFDQGKDILIHSRDSTCVGLEAQATRVTKTGSSLCAGGRCTEGQGLQHSAIDRVPGGSSRNAGRPSGLRLLVSASQARLGEARLSREGRTSLNPLFFLRIFSRDRKIRLRGPFPVFR